MSSENGYDLVDDHDVMIIMLMMNDDEMMMVLMMQKASVLEREGLALISE